MGDDQEDTEWLGDDDDENEEPTDRVVDEDAENDNYGDDDDEEGGETIESAGMSALKDVADKNFEEVKLPADVVAAAQETWSTFLTSASSREAAGEAIYAALFDSAPSLQSLFKTPRSVMAMRFMTGLSNIIQVMGDPKQLKIVVETLGFQHLDLEVTIPRVVIFRDAIVDLFDMELGARFSSKARNGFMAILNYAGGAYIYIRREYAVRIKTINTSWRTANNKASDANEHEEDEGDGEGEEGEDGMDMDVPGENGDFGANMKQNMGPSTASGEAREAAAKDASMKVPSTFNEMFMFNGAVMGFGSSLWMNIVLMQFDNMVLNVANSYRLQEECDVLALTLAKYKGDINLGEFKAVMLASMRSLVPKDWDNDHEVAWTWLWENIERMLISLMGKPQVQQKALERFIMSLTEDSVNYLRREVFKRFFALAPAGQDYFKQSTTRLYWIADKIVEMTIEMYREPKKMVEDISALGLRHVGYAIPTEFFAPFVSGAVEVVLSMNTDAMAEDAFRWSLTLISKILVRTIMEGSTIVMKAINTNSERALQKAISVAPRGKRSLELLNITVGTQSISPLYWAIESGSLQTASAMIKDLLTIRADRDNYYYGCDDLFTRHADIVKILLQNGEGLVPTLLDGLIWRSRTALNGQRRVNYYVKHLIVDEEGKLNKPLEWLVENKNPKLICHPVVVLFADLLWMRVAQMYFIVGRCWYIFTLVVFIFSQSVLKSFTPGPETPTERIAVFACRAFIYGFSLTALLRHQLREIYSDVQARNFQRVLGIPFPKYLSSWKEFATLMLVVCLFIMLANEPIFHCAGNMNGDFEGAGLFTQVCPAGVQLQDLYSTASMVAMILYWALVTDVSILSTRISAFVLVCSRVISELFLFLGALAFLIVSFASSIGALDNLTDDFSGIENGLLSLFQIGIGMYPQSHFEDVRKETMLMIAVSVFIIISLIFLLNLLVAQLNGAYQAVYDDMVGYARLQRGQITVVTIASVSTKWWSRFVDSLKLDERLEFNEGDIGLAGGIQVHELANANPTTTDAIKRFGGSTSPAMQWPEEEGAGDTDESKFDRLEKLIARATKNIGGAGSSGKGGKTGSSRASGSRAEGSSDNNSGGSDAGGSGGDEDDDY